MNSPNMHSISQKLKSVVAVAMSSLIVFGTAASPANAVSYWIPDHQGTSDLGSLPTNAGSKLIAEAVKHIGTPYELGSKTYKNGTIDCAGFIYQTFKAALNLDVGTYTGWQLPYFRGQASKHSNKLTFFNTSQIKQLQKNKTTTAMLDADAFGLTPGSLIFYGNPDETTSHIVFYYGKADQSVYKKYGIAVGTPCIIDASSAAPHKVWIRPAMYTAHKVTTKAMTYVVRLPGMSMRLEKLNDTGSKALNGAKFDLYYHDKYDANKLLSFEFGASGEYWHNNAYPNNTACMRSEKHGTANYAAIDKLPYAGTYWLHETQAPAGYQIKQEWTELTVAESSSPTTVFAQVANPKAGTAENNGKLMLIHNANKPGDMSIRVRKVDSKTGAPLANAQFTLYAENNEHSSALAAQKSNADGYAIFDQHNTTPPIQAGKTYYVKEIEAPLDEKGNKYNVDFTGLKPVTAKDGEVVEIVFTDTKPTKGVEVSAKKVDGLTGNTLPGAQFRLSGESGTYTATSDSDGIAWFHDVKNGTYTLTEIAAPPVQDGAPEDYKGYKVSKQTLTITVQDGQVIGDTEFVMKDVPDIHTKIDAHKYGEYDDENGLGGCQIVADIQYQKLNEDTFEFETVHDTFEAVSAADGTVTFDVPGREPQFLSIKEKEHTVTNQGGYTWAGTRTSNYVYPENGGSTPELPDKVYNFQQKSIITVLKRDKNITDRVLTASGEWTKTNGEKPEGDATFAGAKFEIIEVTGHDANGRPIGNQVQSLTTDQSGSASSSQLQQGIRYAIMETNAPLGHLLYDHDDYATYHGSWYQEFVCLFDGDHSHLTTAQGIKLLSSASDTTGTACPGGVNVVTCRDKVKEGYLKGHKFKEKDPNGNVDGDDNQPKEPLPGITFDIYLESATPTMNPSGVLHNDTTVLYDFGISKKDGHKMTSDEIKQNPGDVKGLVDTRVTDKNGEWISRLLPYGKYAVVERDAITGYDKAAPAEQWVDTQVTWNAAVSDFIPVHPGNGLGNDNGLGIEHDPITSSTTSTITAFDTTSRQVVSDVESAKQYSESDYGKFLTEDHYNALLLTYTNTLSGTYYKDKYGNIYDKDNLTLITDGTPLTDTERQSFAESLMRDALLAYASQDILILGGSASAAEKWYTGATDIVSDHITAWHSAHSGQVLNPAPHLDSNPEGYVPHAHAGKDSVMYITAPLYIENQVTARHVRIQKTDSVSGKIVPYSNFYFKVWDCTRKCWVTDNQTVSAALNKVTIWKTDEKGNVTGNDKGGAANIADLLEWGSAGYDIYEVHVGTGYYLTDKPVHFTLDGTVDPLDQTLVVNFADAPVLGTATLTKTGDGATAATGSDGSKQFTYTNVPLPGAVYGVYAAEDITARDIDSTVRSNRNTTLSKTYSVDDKYGKHREISFTFADTLKKDALVETAMTDSKGQITTSKLYEGKYYFKELYSPVGYTLSDDKIAFEIKDTHNIPFDLNDAKLNPQEPHYIGSNTQNNSSDKTITKENLDYTAEERRLAGIKTGIATADPLAPLEHVDCTANDTRQQAHINLLKRFVELPIAKDLDYTGATVIIKAAQNIPAVKDKDGKEVLPATKLGDTIQTITLKKGDNPQKVSTKLLAVGGKYTATMTVTPEPDKIGLRTDKPYSFISTGTGSYLLDLTTNFLYKWNTANEQKHLKATPDKLLKNCVFGLYAAEDIVSAKDGSVIVKKDTLLSKFQFDENGKATNVLYDKDDKPTGKLSIDIPAGDYYVKELKTADGYTLNSEKYDLLFYPCGVGTDINGLPDQKHSQTIEVTTTKTPLLNRPYDVKEPNPPAPYYPPSGPSTGDFTFTKTDKLTGSFLPGAEVSLKDSAGTTHTVTTGTDGKLAITGLPVGTATWWESKAPDGYVLDSTIHTIIISAGQVYTATLADKPITGTFEFTKTDIADDKPLPDCVISITNSKTGKVVFTGKTDNNGKLEIKDIPAGDYTYQEVSAPPKYKLDNKAYPFSIKEDGQVVKAAMKDQIMTGTFEFTKTDFVTARALPDTGISIKDASTGKIVFTGKTDKDGKLIVKLPVGKYTYQEVKAPANYAIDKKAYPFEIKADGEIVKADMKDTLQTGTLEIVKTMDGKKDGELDGIQFRVTGVALNGQKYDKTFSTDKHGMIEVKGLPVGTYTIHELSGAKNKGYVLAADKTVSVKANLVASVKIDNQKVKTTTVQKTPTVPAAPKTGQNPVVPVIVILVMACAAGAGAFELYHGRRKKSKN